jgi:hypothetical protein
LANSGKVQLKRTDREGRVQSMEIDVKSIMKDSKTRDIELRDGDIIFVPERLT